MTSLGEYIHLKRKQRALTLQQVSDRVGLSVAYLSDLERGKRIGSASIWRAVGKALDCNVDVLCGMYALDAKQRAEGEWNNT